MNSIKGTYTCRIIFVLYTFFRHFKTIEKYYKFDSHTESLRWISKSFTDKYENSNKLYSCVCI